ncbi:DMT family transporter, partial [Candidatus Microgenomates bacterium]|nr:DMT family transporter [Candidatus Microgenomates bacterium]
IKNSDYVWFVLMIIPGLIALVSMFIAFNYLSLGTVLFTYYAVSTLGSYLLGKILFNEQLDKIKITSLVLSLVGLYFTFSDSLKPGNINYLLLACSAGLGTAGWTIVSKKISSKYSVNQILIMDSLLMVVVGLPIAIFKNEPVSLPSFTLPWFGILGYSIAAIGSSVFTLKGFKLLQAQIGSIILLVEPIFGALLGYLIYREIFTTGSIIGAILILLGVAIPNINFYFSKNDSKR